MYVHAGEYRKTNASGESLMYGFRARGTFLFKTSTRMVRRDFGDFTCSFQGSLDVTFIAGFLPVLTREQLQEILSPSDFQDLLATTVKESNCSEVQM